MTIMRTKQLGVLLVLGILIVLLSPMVSAAAKTTLAAPSKWPSTQTGIRANPPLIVNVTCEDGATVYFTTNASGAWLTIGTYVITGKYTACSAFYNDTTMFYGSETKYWWGYNIQNTTGDTVWVNATTYFTTKVITLGETIAIIVGAFVPVLIFMAILGMLFKMLGRIKL